MKNRSILARLGAKFPKKTTKKTTVAPPVAEVQILMKNPETGEVDHKFNNIDEAVAGGFNKANINIALKNGTKYKGHLWVYSK